MDETQLHVYVCPGSCCMHVYTSAHIANEHMAEQKQIYMVRNPHPEVMHFFLAIHSLTCCLSIS